jgi:peptide/nickel transport system substrate-binding protein
MPLASQAARVASRREFLRVAGLLSLGAGLLSACSPTAAPTAAPTTAPAAPAATVAAPAATPAPAATGEATLVLGVDAESLDPLVTTNAFSRSMMKAIFDTLVVLDPKLAPQPALATSWETPDDTTWRFTLRQGV